VNERTSADVLEEALQVILEAVEHERVDVEQARRLVRSCGLVGAARVVDPVRAPQLALHGERQNGHPAA
jgi:hypothetical protein